ncbi:MAG: AAA family ATPase [Candidatus Dormibacteraeota bacterium]|uniref:AAA family ATPase n=1 Tax=Candidatus Amunia macphersoniae TaxID=3127014 RepID=A0A934KP30_9BACT|nr:AAA family ATPase [Candidatus Dormibacteraeota bacterium]
MAPGLAPTGARGLTVRLIAPDLALDRLHLVVPDGSDAMVVLTTLADGDAGDADPRDLFAQRISEVGHLTVSFGEDDPPHLLLSLPDLALQCVPQESPNRDPDHLALRVVSMRPAMDHPEGSKVLTVTARTPIVTAANGVLSDTRRLLDWRSASATAAKSAELYAALKLVDSLERAERQRAATQRTHFIAAKEYWRCKRCRALWRPADHERCPSCGHEFSDVDRRQPEVGKVEFTVPEGEQINLTSDAAVLVEPEDEPNFVGRVSRIDHHRHTVEITCRTFEHAGTEGTITPSFNKALYQAKRSVLAAIATRDFGVGLLAQLMVSPQWVTAPVHVEDTAAREWLTEGMMANPPQDRAVALLSKLAAGEAVFIQGPPGTGKTTVIVEAIKRRLAANPDERILVTSHSNLAVDNALERLAGTPGMRAVRVARAERVHPTVDRFRCDDEDDPRLLEANCYFATCATAATSAITDMNFDMVILDEANKARVDEALPALRLGSALALVGDHKQLPPVEDDALYGIVESDEALETLVNRSLFEQAWEGGLPESARCLLTIQHRMHPDIAAYVSKASYEGQLQDAPEVQAYDYITRTPFPVALHFVDTEGMRGVRERRGPGGALRNEAEVRVAAQVVRLLDERAPREMSMAVIAMYAEQVERLRQALGRRRFKRPVKIDTVDSFEGREEDMVVISLVRSNERGRIGFLRVPNRLNVAISRAKHLVACIGDSATLRAGEESMYGELVEAARSTGGWLSALDIVSPGKPQRRRRGAPVITPRVGADGEPLPADESEEGARRRRRRRRRGQSQGQGGPRAAADAQQQTTTGDATTTETQLGPDGEPLRRRRRRRRKGRGPGAGGGGAGPETTPGAGLLPEPPGASPSASPHGGLHFAPGETQSFRPRRRRRRRGATGQASGGSGQAGGGSGPPRDGGDGPATSTSAPSPPASAG